jgi:hypothetical protein
MVAPDPRRRRVRQRARARSRRPCRFPPHTKGVGARFQPATVASNQAMIAALLCGCCPANARALRMCRTDSARFTQDPESGV